MVMQVSVNGEPRQLHPGTTISQLLEVLDLKVPQVAVELNRDVVPRAQHDHTQLSDGDEVEVVTLVGGG